MRRVGVVTLQILGAAVLVALVCGLIGLIVSRFRQSGAFGTYWGESSPLPQSPLQVALGGGLAFAAGVGLLILTYQ